MRRRLRALALGLCMGGFLAGDALAVIGRPATPGSVAGVARRTSRRTVRRSAYVAGAQGAYVTSVPSGCQTVSSPQGTHQTCGGATYTPYYDGTTVVYHVEH